MTIEETEFKKTHEYGNMENWHKSEGYHHLTLDKCRFEENSSNHGGGALCLYVSFVIKLNEKCCIH